MHKWLERRGEICFGLTVILLALFLILYPLAVSPLPVAEVVKEFLEKHFALWLTFVAAFLPALGAAFGMPALGGAIGGSMGGLFGSSPSMGGGNMLSGDAYGGSASNPLPGLNASDYG